jgi:hypothetical protein
MKMSAPNGTRVHNQAARPEQHESGPEDGRYDDNSDNYSSNSDSGYDDSDDDCDGNYYDPDSDWLRCRSAASTGLEWKDWHLWEVHSK